MCGRYIATSTPDDIKDVFSASGHPNFPPRFNICPSDDIQVIRLKKKNLMSVKLYRCGGA